MSTEKPGAHYVGPDRSVLVSLVERGLEPLLGQGHLPSDENEHLRRADGVGADEAAFDQLVRVALDQGMVLERGGFALVAVDDQVDGLGFAQHAPLATGVEAGPPAAEDARGQGRPGAPPRASWPGHGAAPRSRRGRGRRGASSCAGARSGKSRSWPDLGARRPGGAHRSGLLRGGRPPARSVLATAGVVRDVSSTTGGRPASTAAAGGPRADFL